MNNSEKYKNRSPGHPTANNSHLHLNISVAVLLFLDAESSNSLILLLIFDVTSFRYAQNFSKRLDPALFQDSFNCVYSLPRLSIFTESED